MATQASIDLAQQLYVTYYGRPADPEGLASWADSFDEAGEDLTAALAAFGTSAEYTDNFASLDNTELVTQLYEQIIGRAPDADGLAFYVGLLDTEAASAADIATRIAAGVSGDDVTTLANKIAVANNFTTAVENADATYDGADDIAAAQAVLALVGSTDASVTAGNAAALVAVAGLLGTTPVTPVDPDADFDLNTAIEGVVAANDNKTTFLLAAKTIAIDNEAPLVRVGDSIDPKVPLLETSLGLFASGAAEQLGVLLGDDPRNPETGAPGAETPFLAATVGVRTAMLADAVRENAKKLTTLQKTEATAQAAVDKVPGLASAILVENAATSRDAAADAVVDTADAEVAAAVTFYNEINTTDIAVGDIVNDEDATTTDGTTTTTTPMDDGTTTMTALIVADATTKALGLATNITETTNQGITALLAAIIAREAAQKTAAGTAAALDTAEQRVNDLDLDTPGAMALQLVGEGFRTVVTAPTRGQITVEETTLKGIKTAADKVVTDAGDAVALEQTAAAAAAAAAVMAFNDLLMAYDTAADTDPLAEALSAAQGVAATVAMPLPGGVDPDNVLGQRALDAAIDKAADALDSVQLGVDTLVGLNTAITAAAKVFTDADLAAPVTLGATALATPKDDTFLVDVTGADEINLSLFGLEGEDVLVIGDDYLRNIGDVTEDGVGDDNVLEYFLSGSKAGAPVWTMVTLETSLFGSSAGEQEVIEITLVGVALADVDVNDGLLTVS